MAKVQEEKEVRAKKILARPRAQLYPRRQRHRPKPGHVVRLISPLESHAAPITGGKTRRVATVENLSRTCLAISIGHEANHLKVIFDRLMNINRELNLEQDVR